MSTELTTLPGRDLEESLRRILEVLAPAFQQAHIGVGRANLVEDVGNVCRDELAGRLAAMPFGVAHNGDGFYRGGEVFTPIFDLNFLGVLTKAGWVTAQLPASCLAGSGLPSHGDLLDAAESALARGKKYGFAVDTDCNAAAVMAEELALVGFEDLPIELCPVLVSALRAIVEREKSASRERSSA